MRILLRSFAILAILISSSFTLRAQYSGGSGTIGVPYQISNTENLIDLSNTNADWNKYFNQTSDILHNIDETRRTL